MWMILFSHETIQECLKISGKQWHENLKWLTWGWCLTTLELRWSKWQKASLYHTKAKLEKFLRSLAFGKLHANRDSNQFWNKAIKFWRGRIGGCNSIQKFGWKSKVLNVHKTRHFIWCWSCDSSPTFHLKATKRILRYIKAFWSALLIF